MLRLILIALLLISVLAGGLALALYQWLGAKGLLIFPVVMLLGLWAGKILVGKAFKHFALSLFSMKAAALRGATMQVHSIVPVPKPDRAKDRQDTDEADADEAEEPDEPEEGSAEMTGSEADSTESEESETDVSDDAVEEEEPEEKEYFAIDLTITPPDSERVWEPGEFVLASAKISSLEDLEEKEVGTTEEVRVWDGSKFASDDQGKYPGIQRLKLTVATKPGTSKAWLHYYNVQLGELDLPPWNPALTSPEPAPTQGV